jgi:xanthine dehydrogenase accessory factor
MSGIATSPLDILRFLIECEEAGRGTILVTLVGIEGSSPRAIGSQMAVASDGEYVGSLSGGCIEAAVAAEAIEALHSGFPRTVRYGAGSPYLDIRLPCGGGIDLLFTPRPDPSVLMKLLDIVEMRRPATLTLGDRLSADEAIGPSGWRGESFFVTYTPPLRILAFGQGEELTATARLANSFGARIEAFTPYRHDVDLLASVDISARLLKFRGVTPRLTSDPWTAIIFLFHDRDWEETLLSWALPLPHLYIGALGSRATHAARIAMLQAAGQSSASIQSIRSPVGMIPSTRDPVALSISILAEIAQSYMTEADLSLGQVDVLAKLATGK